MSELRGGEQFLGWDLDRYFMAATLDAVRENTYAVIAANSAKGKKPKPPKPVERPAEKTRPRSNTAANPFAVMAAQQLAAARKNEGG